MKVVCKFNRTFVEHGEENIVPLTVGKVYEVEKEGKGQYKLRNDRGQIDLFTIRRFRKQTDLEKALEQIRQEIYEKRKTTQVKRTKEAKKVTI